MKQNVNTGFIVTLSGRWPRELPEKRFKEYGEWCEKNLTGANIRRFGKVVGGRDDMEACIEDFRKNGIELIVMVYGAFTGDDICCGLADALHIPVILWAPREEKWEREDRLYANALCSAAMNGASMKRIGAPHHIVFGNKEEERVRSELNTIINAYAVVKKMRGTTFGLFGYRPTAFYNCSFDEVAIRKTFGIDIEETDLKVVFDRMADLPREEVEAEMERTAKRWDTASLPAGYLENHVRLYLTLKTLMPEQRYDYASIKCWPEMGNLKTTPCAVLGRLADEGFFISCEGDVDAALAAVAQNIITGGSPFIADLINIDEEENTVTFWHCGNAAPSLHDQADGVKMCNHPLAGQGTAFWCSLKEGPVTAARFSNIDGQYRLFVMRGTAVPTKRCTRGSMVNVKTNTPVFELVNKIADSGMSHHYSVIWGDVADDLILAAELLNIPVIEL